MTLGNWDIIWPYEEFFTIAKELWPTGFTWDKGLKLYNILYPKKSVDLFIEALSEEQRVGKVKIRIDDRVNPPENHFDSPFNYSRTHLMRFWVL